MTPDDVDIDVLESVLAESHREQDADDRAAEAMTRAAGHAADRFARLSVTGILARDRERDHALVEAVMAWRDVDRVHVDDDEARDALLRLRDAADRYAGLGIGR